MAIWETIYFLRTRQHRSSENGKCVFSFSPKPIRLPSWIFKRGDLEILVSQYVDSRLHVYIGLRFLWPDLHFLGQGIQWCQVTISGDVQCMSLVVEYYCMNKIYLL